MPVEFNYNIISKRFDFGVPLEDIFAQGDIHPRLKFIFQQAFELYLDSHLNIEDILNEHFSLQEYLDLKQSIIYDKQPGIQLFRPVGAYFWVIRHFLGLLPIPLLPSSTSTHKYPWQELSRKCRNLLRSKFTSPEQYNFLNYSISRSLHNLPEEHILLLKTVIIFIREVSKKQLSKKTFQTLTRYYSDAIFIRPFTPGLKTGDDHMSPLLIYLGTKGYYIVKNLRTFYMPLFSENLYIAFQGGKISTSNSQTQTNPSTSKLLYMNNIHPSFTVLKYLKDAESQTEFDSEEKLNYFSAQYSLASVIPEHINISDISNHQEQIHLNDVCSPLKLRKLTSFVSSLVDINEDEENGNKNESIKSEHVQSDVEFDEDNTKFYSIYEECNAFNSTLSSDQNLKWNDVVEEIQRTVKRVESYNYEEENYASALEYRSASSSSIESTFSSGTGTDYTSFIDLPMQVKSNESQQSNGKNKKKHNLKTYKRYYSSEDELYFLNESDDWEDEEETSSNVSTKKLKLNFKFFKSISPQLKRSGKVLKNIGVKNIKYRRFQSSSS